MTYYNGDFTNDQHGWTELLPQRKSGAAPRLPRRAAWVVVGAGLTGLSCARRLAALHPHEEIILLDARLVGQGASGRNSGFTVAVSHFSGGYKAGEKENYKRINRINQAGVNLLRRHVNTHAIECQWDESGFYHTAADVQSSKEHTHFLRYLSEMEIPHTPLGQSNLQSRLGTSLYKRGVYVPSGVLVQPAALVRGLADTLPNNVSLFEQTPVLKIEQGSPICLHLKEGIIHTDKLILAVNYEASKLGFLRRRLIGSTLSGSFTRVLTKAELSSLGRLKQWGAMSLHSGGATVRLTADGRICLRNTAEYYGGKLLSSAALARRKAVHRAAFEKRFPQLSHVPFEYSWSGVEGISRNGTNFFGQNPANIYLAGGYNGSGVSRGTAFGAALAEYATGGQSELINDCLASVPARYIPPRPFLDIGAAITIARRFAGAGLDR